MTIKRIVMTDNEDGTTTLETDDGLTMVLPTSLEAILALGASVVSPDSAEVEEYLRTAVIIPNDPTDT